MTHDDDFSEFLRRIRSGDEQAATDLVRRYEPILRREIRLHLNDPSLARLVDSSDICQSVLASFFIRAASGQFDLAGPKEMLGLLLTMARRKVAFAARKHAAQRRDRHRTNSNSVDELAVASKEATPSRIVASRELLQQLRERLNAEDRQLAERRAQGDEWAKIASELGGTPDGRRMQLGRALDRVTRDMGLEEDADE